MSQKEVIYLVGDFSPSTLDRWVTWAQMTNREIKRVSTFNKLQGLDNSPVIILDDHGLNDLYLPERS